jgi:WD40 repeat protein
LAINLRSELQLSWQARLSDLVTAIKFAPNGRGWAASSAAGAVIWNSGLTEMVVLKEPDGQSIDEIAFSADSRWLASGGQGGQLLIWNCDDADLPPQLVDKFDIDNWIEHLAWHPTKPELAISYGANVRVWNMLVPTEPLSWKFDRSSVFDLAWHPDGTSLAVAGYKGVQIWSPTDSAPEYSLNVDTASIKVAWSGDGRYLAAGNLDRTLTILDEDRPEDPWTLQGCPGKIRQLAWVAGTTPCLAVASGTSIVMWNLTSDATVWSGRLLEGHQDIIIAMSGHPNVPILASGSADGYACLWSETGEIEQILALPIVSGFTSISWHPHHLYLATGTQTGDLGLWVIPA